MCGLSIWTVSGPILTQIAPHAFFRNSQSGLRCVFDLFGGDVALIDQMSGFEMASF